MINDVVGAVGVCAQCLFQFTRVGVPDLRHTTTTTHTQSTTTQHTTADETYFARARPVSDGQMSAVGRDGAGGERSFSADLGRLVAELAERRTAQGRPCLALFLQLFAGRVLLFAAQPCVGREQRVLCDAAPLCGAGAVSI